jgi:hypothetical protein
VNDLHELLDRLARDIGALNGTLVSAASAPASGAASTSTEKRRPIQLPTCPQATRLATCPQAIITFEVSAPGTPLCTEPVPFD